MNHRADARIAITVVRVAARLVPRSLRAAFIAEWRGEIDHYRPATEQTPARLVRRSLGSLLDAASLRSHSWSPDMITQDLRFAVRTLLQSPGFTAVAVAVLAIGIAINAALFSVVNATLIAPLPFPEPERLVRIYGTDARLDRYRSNANPNDAIDVRERAASIEALAYSYGSDFVLGGLDAPLRVRVERVEPTYFEVLRVQPAVGRSFRTEDGTGDHRVAILSHDAWQRLFGGAGDMIGHSVDLDGQAHEIVGIAPRGFQGPFGDTGIEIWTPTVVDPENRGGHFVRVFARLAPGTTMAAAQQEIDSVYAGIAAEFEKPERGLAVLGLQESIVGDVRPLLLTLLAAVGFVLLIACANLANLLLARAVNRRRELAVRCALGAGSGRLARQLITESLLLALTGGAAGVGLASLLLRLAEAGPLASIPTLFNVAIDGRVLVFSLAVSLITGLLFGAGPAWQAARQHPAGVLRETRGASPGARLTGRRALVTLEVAMSVMLLVGAGLMLRSFQALAAVDPGFDPAGVLSLHVQLPEDIYPEPAAALGAYERLMERLRARPDVKAVGLINRLPLGRSYSCDLFVLEGWPNPEPGADECAEERVVGGDYFAAMGMEILAGRALTASDTEDSEPVVVVSRSMADRFMPAEDPIGRGFKWGLHDERPFRRIVGVIEDVRHFGLDADPGPEVYMPQPQYPYYGTQYLVLHSDADPAMLVNEVRSVLADVAPAAPIYDIATMQDRLAASVAPQRQTAWALAAFATMALLLTCVGLYGVLAYAVSGRRHEIGVRMALGARSQDVVRLITREGFVLAAAGAAIGLVSAAALAGSMRGMLFGIEPLDQDTFIAVPIVLGLVALLASYVPARRASRVDPLQSLRRD